MLDYTRQLGIINPDAVGDVPIIVVGAGGIGGPTTFALAKMGFRNITVFDHDLVEPHNIPNQIYRETDIGARKVDALAEIVKDFAGIDITPIPQRFTPRFRGVVSGDGIIVTAVDNMASRIGIWRFICESPPSWYIDCRMGGRVLWVQVVNMNNESDMKRYQGTLYGDPYAVQEPCTARAVWYNAIAGAAMIARAIKRVVLGERVQYELMFDVDSAVILDGQ